VSDDLVRWRRLGPIKRQGLANMCSGGATLAPDGSPLLLFCEGATLVPAAANDSDFVSWTPGPPVKSSCLGAPGEHHLNCTNAVPPFLPPSIPGLWDGSVWKDEATGTYRATFGSCEMLGGKTRPAGLIYCSGPEKTGPLAPGLDGTPQVAQFTSRDLKTWKFLGVPWRAPLQAADRPWGPRIECPVCD